MIDNIRKYHMTDNKQTVQFDIEYFQGVTCIGCAMIEDLAIEVEFTSIWRWPYARADRCSPGTP